MSASLRIVVVCQEGDGPDNQKGLLTGASGREEK